MDTNPETVITKEAIDISVNIKQLLQGDQTSRFALELEFVELLTNPYYLQYLSQERYFEDEKFVNYLKYLIYWKRPEYLQYISHPHCLYFLELLQREEFRTKLADPEYIEMCARNQFYHWRFFRANRWVERNEREASGAER
eukprot:168666_1